MDINNSLTSEEVTTFHTILTKIETYRKTLNKDNLDVNMPYTMVSDAANKASISYPFAACYWDTPSGRVFGLRSQTEGLDVSVIAERYGGGGHKHASDFRVSFYKLKELGLI